jgi:hypothetical protein
MARQPLGYLDIFEHTSGPEEVLPLIHLGVQCMTYSV